MRLSRQELTPDEANDAFAAIDQLLGLLTIIPISEAILTDAASTIRQTRLRSLDAIQLATARSITADSDTSVIFVASDKRLLEAAQTSGLTILNPEL